MKYFLIADDQGNPIFYNHPEGRLICSSMPLMLGGQLTHVFDEQCRSIRCGRTLFVAQQVNQITFLVASDQGESEIFLRRQLQLVQQLLMLLYGPNMPSERRQAKMQERIQRQELLKRLIDTLCWLCDKHQSFLVDANEQLEVNEEIRRGCSISLKDSLKNLPNAMHGMLFVGTKLLALYSKQKVPELDSVDLLLLAIYVQGQFDPKTVEMEETQLPVADYTDHEEVIRELNETRHAQINNSAPPSIFPDLPEEFAFLRECGKPLFQVLFEELIRDEGMKPAKKFLEFQSKGLPAQIGDDYRQSPPPNGLPIVILQLAFRVTYPEFPKLPITGQYDSDTRNAIFEFQKSHGIDETGDFDFETVKLIFCVAANPHEYAPAKPKGSAPPPAAPAPAVSQTSVPPASSSSSLNTGVSSSPSLKNAGPPDTLFETLHLKIPRHFPHFVYCTKLEQSITLIVINKKEPANDDPNTREQLRTVKLAVKKSLQNFMGFLLTKETTHLSMLPFMNQYPGLVHFIFVDRVRNRMVAPAITPLHGQEFMQSLGANQEHFSNNMVDILKHHVWDLCYQSQLHLCKGYSAMLMKVGSFKYSYRLWIQDEDGFELPLEQSLIFQKGALPLDNTYYRGLLTHLFPNRKRLRCFELYALYLGVVSPKTIATHNMALAHSLYPTD